MQQATHCKFTHRGPRRAPRTGRDRSQRRARLLRRLDRAFGAFLRRVQTGERPGPATPRFKARRRNRCLELTETSPGMPHLSPDGHEARSRSRACRRRSAAQASPVARGADALAAARLRPRQALRRSRLRRGLGGCGFRRAWSRPRGTAPPGAPTGAHRAEASAGAALTFRILIERENRRQSSQYACPVRIPERNSTGVLSNVIACSDASIVNYRRARKTRGLSVVEVGSSVPGYFDLGVAHCEGKKLRCLG